MSGSMGKSDSSQNTGFNQEVWAPQGDALQNLYGQAGNLATGLLGGGKGGKGSAMDQAQFGQGYQQDAMNQMMPSWQQQMQGGAYADMGLQQNLMDSLNQSLGQPTATQGIYQDMMGGQGNDYLDALKGSMTADAMNTMGQSLGALDQRAAASGMSGGSRQGVAQAQIAEDTNRNLTNQMNQMGYNTFDQDLQNKLAIANQADQSTLARQGMMQNMLGQQQNAMYGGLGFGQNMTGLGQGQQMMPWQQMGAYSNILGGPTVLGQGTSSGSSKGKSLAGGM